MFAGCALGGYALDVVLAAPRRTETDAGGSLWPASALTGLLEAVVARRWGPAEARSLAILLAMACGAAAAAALIRHAMAWLPALQLLPLAIVQLVSLR